MKKSLFTTVYLLAVGLLASHSAQAECTGCPCEENLTHQVAPIEKVSDCIIELPSGIPSDFSVTLPYQGQNLTLKLKKHQVFGENTRFFVADEMGALTQVEKGLDLSYSGHVQEHPSITVTAVLSEIGLVATLSLTGEKVLLIEPVRAENGGIVHQLSLKNIANLANCSHGAINPATREDNASETLETIASLGPTISTLPLVTIAASAASSSSATLPPQRVMEVREYEIGVEIGSRAFFATTAYNGNLAMAQSVAQSIVTNLDRRYLHAAGIKYRLGTVIIRTDVTSDPLRNTVTATGGGNGALSSLSAFRDYWNTNPDIDPNDPSKGKIGTSHDLAVYHVLSSPSGLAYVNSVGGSSRYATSGGRGATSWANGTLTHEFGHSWNLRHVADPPIAEYNYDSGENPPSFFYESKPRSNGKSAGGSHTFVSIMDGRGQHNIGRLSTDEANTVYAARQAKPAAGDVISSPAQIKPFGHRDSASATGSPITIDVIANDYDANNDVLDVELRDTISQNGATITLSQGTGPGGRNELIYTPASNFSGPDFFHYNVCDSTGLRDWGACYVLNSSPEIVNLSRSSYFYDLGTPSSPLFTGGSNPYQRLSNLAFGDISFTSNGPFAIESRDRESDGQINGVNNLNRDHIRMRSSGSFSHKLATGSYDILFTVGDATENTGKITFTAEGADSLTTASHVANTFTSYVLKGVSVLDGELNVDIDVLGFTANITRITIARVGLIVDPTVTSYDYDLGSPISPIQNGWTQLAPNVSGDISWSGDPVNGFDTGSTPGVNSINRDYVTGAGVSTLNHKLPNATWRISLNMGNPTVAFDDIRVRAEGITISDNIDLPAGKFLGLDTSGATPTTSSFDVVITDGELNLEFSDTGGLSLAWVVNRMSMRRLDGDADNDSYSDLLELAAGTSVDDPLSVPTISSRDLAGYWPLDETSGETAADASGNNHDATWQGNTGENSWVNGLIGRGAQINDEDGGSGTEHFSIPDLSSINNEERFTISLWFNQDVDTNDNSTYNGLFMTRDMQTTVGSGGGENWGIALEDGNDETKHIDWRFDGKSKLELGNISQDSVDAWQHILYTWDGISGTAALYLNGEVIESTSAPTGSIISGGEWRIGDDAVANNREFTGTLDDIAVFRDALTKDDAALIYNTGIAGFPISQTFTPPVAAPIVTTGKTEQVLQTSATALFELNDDGDGAPSLSLYYGTTDGGTDQLNWENVIDVGILSEGSHGVAIGRLIPDTQYFYNINAVNTGGDTWGSSKTFSTLPNNFATWAGSNGVSDTATDDDDDDGFSNLLEYALGLKQGSPDQNVGSFNGSLISFPKGAEALVNGDVLLRIETSPTMQDPWTVVTPTIENDSIISYMLPTNQGRLFARLRVTQRN